ncbi:gliding motility-associated-like protein [Cellulophaga sp. RHA_52]|uniref:T9SS type B sorting domain-containing protein n=1 Tax=Cellulophaga sp. RHA_52 TaxID=1250036 RepID=UPI00119BEBF5|nr:T9SS type B sorting domain-containing protein [Cellulophaga sp. RHA_52]TVZ10547.1 gliding motility-associated-like protein [Cellulophaga sp. RHA_52]
MKRFYAIAFFFFTLGLLSAGAQVSADCSNAIPICNNTPTNGGTDGYGVDDFGGAAETGCLERTLSGAIESNSAWYRFKTGEAGQLGFNISFDSAEDWDYALYKASDCANLEDPVRCNFFDNGDGNSFTGVGEDPTGATNVQYEDWLTVEAGEEYYLLINNFSNVNSGFSIQFSGQIFIDYPNTALDCSIINNLLGSPIAACDGDIVRLDATTPNTASYTWYRDIGLGFTEILGETNAFLDVTTDALYRVEVVLNTADVIISDVQVAFSTAPTTNPITDVTLCQEDLPFNLTTKSSEALGGQSASDFIISYHATPADAINNSLSLPMQYSPAVGAITVYVRTTSVKNPKCFDVSEEFEFTVVETPISTINTEVFLCEGATSETIGETNPNVNYSYNWQSGETTPTIQVFSAGTYVLDISSVAFGVTCVNTIVVEVVVGQTPSISNVLIEDFNANNTVTVETDIDGNFEYQIDTLPVQDSNVFTNVSAGAHTVTIIDKNGCGYATEDIVVVGFDNYFTPNGDGINDTWKITGMESLQQPVVHIFDRYGKLLKELKGSDTWNGTYGGRLLPESDYWFKLNYINTVGDRVTAKHISSHFTLKR